MLFYNIFNYLPLSLGIAFARLIKLAPIYMISMGRLFEGIVITAFTYRAIRMVKSERVSYALALMNLFPMSLIFITSYSYDGIVLMVVTCAAACIFRLMQKDDSPSIALIIESFIWFFLLGAVKGGGYLMFLPLVFLILRKPLRSKWNLIPLGLVLVSVASVILFDCVLRPDIGFFQLGGEEGHFEASFALYHPLKYVFMCLSTLLAYSGEIFVDSIGRCEGWNEEAVPVLLILVIQGCIWINFSYPTLMNKPIFFIGYLIVSSIQMGANIDYAIVIAGRYTELRQTMGKKDAIIDTMNLSFPTIITSGTMLAVAGTLIGKMTSDCAIYGIGKCLGRGTIISILITMFVLPQILLVGDKVIELTAFVMNVPLSTKQRSGTMRIDGAIRGHIDGNITGVIHAVVKGNVSAFIENGDVTMMDEEPFDTSAENVEFYYSEGEEN